MFSLYCVFSISPYQVVINSFAILPIENLMIYRILTAYIIYRPPTYPRIYPRIYIRHPLAIFKPFSGSFLNSSVNLSHIFLRFFWQIRVKLHVVALKIYIRCHAVGEYNRVLRCSKFECSKILERQSVPVAKM